MENLIFYLIVQLNLIFGVAGLMWPDKLMPVFQDTAGDQRGVFQFRVDPERQVNALGDLIDDSIGDEHLYADAWVGSLECADQWRKQSVRNTRWRSQPQFS